MDSSDSVEKLKDLTKMLKLKQIPVSVIDPSQHISSARSHEVAKSSNPAQNKV